MAKRLWPAVALAVAAAACGGATTAGSVLEDAQEAMGNPGTIQYSGTGMNAFFGQALTAGEAWPRRDLSKFTRTIDYEQRAARDEMSFAQPVFGGQQQTQAVNGDRAWNVGPQGPAPQLAAAEERQLHIWLTPHGFLRAAREAGNATLMESEGANVVSFTALGKYPVQGTINAQNQVARVATTIANPVLGDTEIVATYSNYRSFDGVQFPARIEIAQGGFPLWELDITEVSTNATLDAAVPEPVGAATIAPVQTMSTQLAPGVWHVTGGSHHSVVVEFADHVTVVEAPLNEERAMAVLAEARKLVPNKPIRNLVTSHHHFDHTGGLRAIASEGITIVTHQSNVPYFEKVLMGPATLVPDAQAKSARKPAFQPVADKHVITDGKQTLEVYATGGDTHTNEYTLVYLPGPRILVEADAFSPGPADAPPPPMPPPNAVKLDDEIQRLKLNVSTIAPIHGRGAVPLAELRRFIGRS
jgi:glyoxylase-like metal-dependent hydrolase (beta-lactamase superfamily II)